MITARAVIILVCMAACAARDRRASLPGLRWSARGGARSWLSALRRKLRRRRSPGVTGLQGLARALNERGVRTARGGM
jgi:hypothetical protein